MNFSLGIYSGLCTDLERESQINGNSENGARFVHAVCNVNLMNVVNRGIELNNLHQIGVVY